MTIAKRSSALVAVALIATGCGVSPDAHYDSAEDLREALEGEDFRCTEVSTSEHAEGYGEEMQCESGLSIIVWEEEIPDYADDPSGIIQIGGQLTGRHYLVSDTWAIGSDNEDLISSIQDTFGGEPVGPNSDLMDIIEEHG